MVRVHACECILKTNNIGKTDAADCIYSRRYLVHREVMQYEYITYLKNYENAKSLKPDANKHGGDIHGHNTEPSAWVISSRHLMVVLSAINERLDEGVCGYCHGRTCTYTHTSKHACTHIYVHIHEHANAGTSLSYYTYFLQ